MRTPNALTTRLQSRFHKAVVFLLILLATVLSSLFVSANAQSVQAMVKNQPFPYKVGVAVDTMLYAALKSKLAAAEQLRTSSEARIRSLMGEITATRQAMDDQIRLGQHDEGKAAGLMARMNILQGEMARTQADLLRAQDAFADILAKLPRSVRKTLINPTAEQLATAVVDYIKTLQTRKWTWAGGAGAIGFVLGMAAILF